MSLVSCWLFLLSCSISAEMSTADSFCTYRSSSILVSSSEIGCSKSRNVFLAIVSSSFSQGAVCSRKRVQPPQYSTGTGSNERQIYQVATVQYGAQAAATSRASLRLTTSPEK